MMRQHRHEEQVLAPAGPRSAQKLGSYLDLKAGSNPKQSGDIYGAHLVCDHTDWIRGAPQYGSGALPRSSNQIANLCFLNAKFIRYSANDAHGRRVFNERNTFAASQCQLGLLRYSAQQCIDVR